MKWNMVNQSKICLQKDDSFQNESAENVSVSKKNESLGNRNNLSLFYLNKFLIRSSKGNETQI